MIPALVPVQLKSPVPEPFTTMLPVADPQALGSVRVPTTSEGLSITVITIVAELAEQPPPSVTVTA
jgi:hypothetical protein